MPLLPELRQCSKSLRTVIHIGDGATPDGLSSYEALIAATAPKPDAKRNGPDLAGVFYADGTTGFPKGVMLRHQALALNALFTARERPANQGRRGVRPTPLYAPEVGHFRIEGDQAITREVASLQPFSAHPSYSHAENEPADFAEAAKLHGYMNNGANEGVVRVAIDVAMGALAQSAQVRLLLMWVAAEALFGADSEISFRIAQRIAMFLGISPDNRKAIFKTVKAGYNLRSKVVHGMKIEGTSPEKGYAAMADIETVLRQSLVKILSSPGLVKAFNSKKRGDFLDGLAFD